MDCCISRRDSFAGAVGLLYLLICLEATELQFEETTLVLCLMFTRHQGVQRKLSWLHLKGDLKQKETSSTEVLNMKFATR